MPLCTCSSWLVAAATVALLLFPLQYLVPEPIVLEDPPPSPALWPSLERVHIPTPDLIFTVALLTVALFTFLCEWIQRKLMERRIVKLNQYLGASLERLRGWDSRQEQLEATLKMVQNATCECDLLLHLLLRQHRRRAAPPHGLHGAPDAPPNCFYDKELGDDLQFLRNPTPL